MYFMFKLNLGSQKMKKNGDKNATPIHGIQINAIMSKKVLAKYLINSKHLKLLKNEY